MKKTLKLCQVLLLLIIFLASSLGINYAYAADVVASGNCGDNITWSLDSEGTLTITGSGDMSGNQCAWADYAEQVKSVVFSGDITSISDQAFKGNSNLESIALPDSVDSIGMNAFRDCTNLKTVTFPDNLTRIGTAAFFNCSSLDNVELKEVTTLYINDYAFYGCTSLKTMTVRPEFVSIGDDAIPELEKVNSYKFSDLYFYARHNGIEFTDLNTNETYTGEITNQDFLDKLPTTNLELGVVQSHDSDYGSVDSFDFYNGKEEDNETYQEIKSIVDEITAGCTTDRDKAYAVADWVVRNIAYGGNLIGVPANATGIYYIFNQRAGRCEGFTMLTNYMLYLCEIPTATVRNTGHEWTAAFVDGEWIYIDTTHNRFDSTDSDAYDIIFLYNGGVYEVSEPTEDINFVATLDIGTEECTHEHTTTHPAVASTCLTQGNNEYVTCDDCGKVISGSDEKLPLGDHNYGELIERVEPEHDSNGIKDGVEAHYECSVCGKLFNEDKQEVTEKDLVIKAPGHSYGDNWDSDDDYHWKECGCGNIASQEAHRGGEATCTEKAVCEVCGASYGELNPDNHKNTELRNEKEATCLQEGYTGDTYCSDCGKLLETGTTIAKTSHRGGEATCTEQAVCGVCGTPYGELDPDNHKNTELRNEKEATCTDDGYTGDKYCLDCGNKLEEGTAIKAKGHQGGEATCTKKAVCEVCGVEYGELNPDSHKNTEVVDAVEATTESEGYSGDVYCTDCGKLVKEGEVIPVKTIEPEENQEETQKNEQEKVENTENSADATKPQTGDNSNMTLWISLLVISGISFVIIAKCKTKRTTGKHLK